VTPPRPLTPLSARAGKLAAGRREACQDGLYTKQKDLSNFQYKIVQIRGKVDQSKTLKRCLNTLKSLRKLANA